VCADFGTTLELSEEQVTMLNYNLFKVYMLTKKCLAIKKDEYLKTVNIARIDLLDLLRKSFYRIFLHWRYNLFNATAT